MTVILVLGLIAYLALPPGALVWVARLASKLQDQEREIGHLTGLVRAMTQGSVKSELLPIPAPVAPAKEPAPSRPTPSTTPSALLPDRKPIPSRSNEEWEAFIGGKLLNRIGALALMIGVAFFLKYAADRNWIPDQVRVAIGGVVGGSLLALAARSHRKRFLVFSKGLVGAGIAILYLSVYATFNFYQLVSQPVAFVLMSGVTVVAFTQTFRYGSIVVAILGWIGGFMTPFLLSTGRNDPVGLFSYLAIPNMGLIIVLIRKEDWAGLVPLAILATWITYQFWHGRYYTPDDLVAAAFFLSLFWLMFHGPGRTGSSWGVNSLSSPVGVSVSSILCSFTRRPRVSLMRRPMHG